MSEFRPWSMTFCMFVMTPTRGNAICMLVGIGTNLAWNSVPRLAVYCVSVIYSFNEQSHLILDIMLDLIILNQYGTSVRTAYDLKFFNDLTSCRIFIDFVTASMKKWTSRKLLLKSRTSFWKPLVPAITASQKPKKRHEQICEKLSTEWLFCEF